MTPYLTLPPTLKKPLQQSQSNIPPFLPSYKTAFFMWFPQQSLVFIYIVPIRAVMSTVTTSVLPMYQQLLSYKTRKYHVVARYVPGQGAVWRTA